MEANRNTYLEVNLDNLKYNYNFFKRYVDKSIFSVVKANAYGLGVVKVAKTLIGLGSQYLCVATLDEALELRKNNINTPILVMGYTPTNSVCLAKKHDITLTVISLNWAIELEKDDIKDLNLHIKINASMNRLGHDNYDEVNQSIKMLKKHHNIEGVFTHYCCNDKNIIKNDYQKFKQIINKLDFNFKWIHASNSYVSLNFDEDFTNAVRVGIGLYGGFQFLGLKNVAALKTEVVLIKEINKNETVSYDGLYLAKQDTKVAALTIGYADGILRSDRNNQVFINNKLYNIIGSICMDQMMIEIDNNVNLYDEVEIFGENLNIKEIAQSRNTIIYEVLTSISNRVLRRYI